MTHRNIASGLVPLLGAALGDALGAGVEGGRALSQGMSDDRESVGRRFFPYSPFGFEPGELTDDTQMAWAAVTAIAGAGRPDVLTEDGAARFLEAVGSAYHRWYESGPPDVGISTAAALSSGSRFGGWISWNGGNSAGNGSLMRATGSFVAGYRGAALLKAAALDSSLTHPDPRCVAACIWYSAALERLSQEAPTGDVGAAFLSACDALLRVPISTWIEPAGAGLGPTWRAFVGRWSESTAEIRATIRGALEGRHIDCVEAPTAAWPTGFVISSLAQAAWAAARGFDAAEILRLSVLHGGHDADSIGAIAGGLAGARFGEAALDHWDSALLGELRLGHRWPGTVTGGPFVELLAARFA